MASINQSTIIDNVRQDLFGNINDDLHVRVLDNLFDRVCAHFKLSYGVEEIDGAFSFIIEDCIIKRFNRRGAEGAKSEQVEGHSVSYDDSQGEFEAYDDIIRKHLKLTENKEKRGGAYFL